MKSLLTLVLIALLQNPPEPRINRDEDLRRQSEDARLRREAEQKKFLEERRVREFQENSEKFMPLGRETCSVSGSLLSSAARMAISGHARKMDGVISRIVDYLGYKRKPQKPATRQPLADIFDQFCARVRTLGPKLAALSALSQKGPWSTALAEESSTELQYLRELLEPLKKP